MAKKEVTMWIITITGFVLAVVMAAWKVVETFGARPSFVDIWDHLMLSFCESGVLYAYAVWIALLIIYGLIGWYEAVNKSPEKQQEERNLVARNYYYTLWVWGTAAMLVQHATLAASARAPIPIIGPDWVLPFIYVLLGLWGMFLVIIGRIYINGYWTNHIYKYNNYTLVQRGIYRRVRHPIYGGQVYLAVSVWLACNNFFVVFLPVLALIYNHKRAMREEAYLNDLTNGKYNDYTKKTPCFMYYPL